MWNLAGAQCLQHLLLLLQQGHLLRHHLKLELNSFLLVWVLGWRWFLFFGRGARGLLSREWGFYQGLLARLLGTICCTLALQSRQGFLLILTANYWSVGWLCDLFLWLVGFLNEVSLLLRHSVFQVASGLLIRPFRSRSEQRFLVLLRVRRRTLGPLFGTALWACLNNLL